MVRKNRVAQEWQMKIKQIQKQKKSKDNKNVSENQSQSENDRAKNEHVQKSIQQKNIVNCMAKSGQFPKQSTVERTVEEAERNYEPQQANQAGSDLSMVNLKHIIQRINNQSSARRATELEQIQRFIAGTASILYISGVTGSGKTTTVVNLLESLNSEKRTLKYAVFNMLKQLSKGEQVIQKIGRSKGKTERQEHQQNSSCDTELQIAVIDECDYAADLESLLFNIRQKFINLKIILISNENCIEKIKNYGQISTLLFMPYTKQDLLQITSSKLAEFESIVPRQIMDEAVKKSLIRSGDYREIEYHITNWAETNLKREHNSIGKSEDCFKNSFLLSIKKYLEKCAQRQRLFLSRIIEVSRPQINTSKKLRCRCKQTQIEMIKRSCMLIFTQQEILMKIKIFEQIGVFEILSAKCLLHSRVFQVGSLKFRVELDYLRELLRSQ